MKLIMYTIMAICVFVSIGAYNLDVQSAFHQIYAGNAIGFSSVVFSIMIAALYLKE